jgi:hypothetical protein
LARLQADLDAAREQAEQQADAHQTFTPEGLVAYFPLFGDLRPEQREVLVLHFQPHTAIGWPARLPRRNDRSQAGLA